MMVGGTFCDWQLLSTDTSYKRRRSLLFGDTEENAIYFLPGSSFISDYNPSERRGGQSIRSWKLFNEECTMTGLKLCSARTFAGWVALMGGEKTKKSSNIESRCSLCDYKLFSPLSGQRCIWGFVCQRYFER